MLHDDDAAGFYLRSGDSGYIHAVYGGDNHAIGLSFSVKTKELTMLRSDASMTLTSRKFWENTT